MADRYHFKNLVFEGGGVKGIAYVGALRHLQDLGILDDIERVGGTSAGAINAVLLSLGYTPDETRDILSKLDFKNFMDDSWGVARDTRRLIKKFGWYRGKFFRDWIGKRIKKKTGNPFSTFNDFHNAGYKDLYLVATNISTGYYKVYSYEHTPKYRVCDAVRLSMSIPLFFKARRDDRDDVFVDGGVLANYPIKLFDRKKYAGRTTRDAVTPPYYTRINRTRPDASSAYCYNKQTLGFRLDSREEIAMFRDGAEPPHADIEDFFDFSVALINTYMNVQNNAHLHSDDWQRTVYIDSLGVGTTDFDINDERKKALEESGVKGVKEYFKWWNAQAKTADLPNNHPEFKV